jgi:general secretion pathway protein B
VSLILDALRRADSERERGAVPGLLAQPVPPLPASAARTASRWRYWLALAAAMVLLAAFGAYVVSREAGRPGEPAAAREPAAIAASRTSQAPAPAAASPAATVSPPAARAVPPATAGVAPTPTPAASAVTSAATASPSAVTATAAPAGVAVPARPAEPQFVAEPAPWPAKAERPAPAAAAASLPAAQREVAAAPAMLAPPPEPPVYTREQLPENIRAELPQLTVGGSIYSASPADRSVIINGRIFRESDRLTHDLSLEQIRLKSVVLSYKGYRFEVSF